MKKEATEDLRIVRTRKLLCKALFELLENTPFDKISVIDICNKALIHRATFYNHFESKNDLLEFAIDEIKEDLFLSVIQTENFSSIKDLYMSLIDKVIDFVVENKSKILLILEKNGFERANGLMLTTINKSINYLIGKNQYNINFAIPKNILADFLSGGITSIGLNWLLSKNPCSKKELLNYFDILLDEKIYLK